MASQKITALAASALVLGLAGCSSSGGTDGQANARKVDAGSGFSLFGGKEQQQAGVGVNAFLWRAALDTVSFMPLASADPWGGVINTEWYSNPEKADERFKATVYILDTRLRADGVTVSVFKEIKTADGWQTAPVDSATGIAIENAILTRARQLRLSSIGS